MFVYDYKYGEMINYLSTESINYFVRNRDYRLKMRYAGNPGCSTSINVFASIKGLPRHTVTIPGCLLSSTFIFKERLNSGKFCKIMESNSKKTLFSTNRYV